MVSVSVKVAVVRDGHVLLVSYNDKSAGFHYNLPGGKVRENEPVRVAAARKVIEETGLAVDVERLLFALEYVPERWGGEFGDLHKVQLNFVGSISSESPRLAEPPFDDPFQLGIEWMPIDELDSIPLLPRIGTRLKSQLGDASARHDALVDKW